MTATVTAMTGAILIETMTAGLTVTMIADSSTVTGAGMATAGNIGMAIAGSTKIGPERSTLVRIGKDGRHEAFRFSLRVT
jgi:hypothetical protein